MGLLSHLQRFPATPSLFLYFMNLSKLCEKSLDGVDEFVGESLSKSNEYSVYVNNDAIGSTCNTSCLSLCSSLGQLRL